MSAPPKKRRGPGRPFPRGVSGNPGGRPKGRTGAEFSQLARAILARNDIIRRLEEIALTAPPIAAMRAIEFLADRGYGQAAPSIGDYLRDERPMPEVDTSCEPPPEIDHAAGRPHDVAFCSACHGEGRHAARQLTCAECAIN